MPLSRSTHYITFSQLLNPSDRTAFDPSEAGDRAADRQWRAAVQALGDLLRRDAGDRPDGVLLCAPTPILGDTNTLSHLRSWTVTTHRSQRSGTSRACLPPSADSPAAAPSPETLSLPGDDPLNDEQFCLVLTSDFSFVMARSNDDRLAPRFQYSFDPDAVATAWDMLRDRLHPTAAVGEVDAQLQQFPAVEPHYKTVTAFGQSVMRELSRPAAAARPRTGNWSSFRTAFRVDEPSSAVFEAPLDGNAPAPDIELLTAIAHEVRTPLSTIRTLTKMLLKRQDLPKDARLWLSNIDRECSEQIGRFELIFKAVELETSERSPHPLHLTATSLADVVDSCIPRWQTQAGRRSLKLDVLLPPKMPQVVSDPNLLDRVLTGAIDHFTSRLPVGSNVQVKVMPAGHQLKLQLKANARVELATVSNSRSGFKSIGQLLNFQPETGNLSLNLSATKNLFHALGGKLTVRNRPQEGDVLTIYLPLK